MCRSVSFAVASALVILASLCLASLPTNSGSARGATPAADPAGAGRTGGEKVLELTDYLKGTAPQIRDRLNSEPERLAGRRISLQAEVSRADAAAKAARQAAADRIGKDARVLQRRKAMADADAALQAARATGTAQQKLDASSTFVAAKQVAEKYERDALAGDKDAAAARKAAEEGRLFLEQCERSLVQSLRWRARLVNAVRTTYVMHWPLVRGANGILGDVKVLKVVDGDSALVEYRAPEDVAEGKEADGLVTIHQLIHRELVVLVGLPAGAARQGETMRVDQAYTVARTVEDEDGNEIHFAKKSGGDLDRLFDLIDPLPKGFDPTEIDAMAARTAVVRKADPKTWSSIQAITAALPADKRPAKGRDWTDRDLQTANDWLALQVVGDKLTTTAALSSAEAEKDGGFTLHARVELPVVGHGVRLHEVTLHCPVALMTRAKQIRPGARVKVSGTIQSIRTVGYDVMEIELADGSF